MAVPTYSDLKNLAFDRAQINVTTDAPISDTEFARYINDALRDVWQMSGGRLKTVPSATAWTAAQLCTGRVVGILTDVEDIIHLWATTTAPTALTTVTSTSTALTSAALFGPITAGMAISGTGIPSNTFVASVTDTSNLTMTLAATDATSNSRTFSPTTGANEVEKVELSEIMWLRANAAGWPTYLVPKKYAVVRRATTTPAAVNLLQLEYWPAVTGFYFPMDYVPQFSEIDSATVTTPDMNDLEARDGGLICAMRLAQAVGRAELVPGIAADISQRTQLAMERKLRAMLEGKQDS